MFDNAPMRAPQYHEIINPRFVDKDLIDAALKFEGGNGARLRQLYNRATEIFIHTLPVTVTYISDNGNYADAARAEIQKRLYDINAILSGISGIRSPDVVYQDIPSQDWRAGAFDLAQPARETVRGPGNILFVNCAPRLKQRGFEKDNKGEEVYAGMLRNGSIVAAVSEYSFVLFRDLVESGDLELYPVQVQTKGSQFRSRDFFTWFTEILAFNMRFHAKDWKSGMDVEERKALLSRLNFIDTSQPLCAEDIEDLSRKPQIIRVDTHGNLKLSIRNTDIPRELWEKELEFNLTNRQGADRSGPVQCALRDNMFDTKSGDIGVAPGSSGNWPDYNSSGSRFLEMAMIGSSLRLKWQLTDQELKEGVRVRIRHLDTQQEYPFKEEPAPSISV